jgi:NDP-sugar pyrophosphorylase family protein
MRRVNLIPMAGAGQRFLDAGYTIPKPLIEVDGTPMAVLAAKSLPKADHWIFICRYEHILEYGIDKILRHHFPCSEIISVDNLTGGQASTCLLAKDLLRPDDILTIGACDNSMKYDQALFELQISKADALIWTFKNNKAVLDNPSAYGWVEVDSNGKAIRISCKKPISDYPLNDHAVIGSFSFLRAELFALCVENMIAKNRKINNEFYMDIAMDELIKGGFDVFPMEVIQYNCYGTPRDLELNNF